MRTLLATLGFVGLIGGAGLVDAADQTILGKQLLVKDPKPGVDPTKRQLVGRAFEKASPNTIVGDPTTTGASLTIFARGTTPSTQTYALPAGLWDAVKTGFKYSDGKLTAGPVKTVQVTLVKGKFQLKAIVSGKTGGVDVVPPNPGTDGCLRFEIAGGDRYDVLFPAPPSATIKKNDAKTFHMKDALVEGSCQPFCTPGTIGCGWEDGQVITHTQLDWGDPVSSAGILLADRYDFVYFGTGGVLEVGLLGAAGFSMAFTSATAILAYQPAIGNVGALDADLVDPTTSASGAFGGEVVALKLNIDFAAAGHTVGSSGLQFSALTLCAFPSNPALNGISVNDFLTMLNSALGGGPAPYTISELHLIAEQVNAAFSNGSPSLFAQDHLFNGACPP